MATDQSHPITEAELLYGYLGSRISQGGQEIPIDQLLAEFKQYLGELNQLRAKLNDAEAAIARGESGPLDVEDVIRRGRAGLATKGIAD